MAKETTDPTSLSEAIEKLEIASKSKVQDFKEILEKDYNELRKTIDELKPQLSLINSKVEAEVKKTKSQVEDNVKQNPWLALGLVGLFAFALGWIFGQSKKGE